MKVKVAQGIQVLHDGDVFADGHSADVPEAVARQWVQEGWAVEVASAPTKGVRR
jgi:hypothetical protein